MKKNNSTSKKKALDLVDCQLIRLLQKDGRVSNTEIAKNIGIELTIIKEVLTMIYLNGFEPIITQINLGKIS